MPFCPNCGAGTSGTACEVCGHKAQPPQAYQVTVAAPELPPLEVGSVISSAFRDAHGVMRTIAKPIAVMMIVAALLGFAFVNWPAAAKIVPVGFDAANFASSLALMVLAYFLVACSVRTIQPAFRFTVERWFVLFGWGILTLMVMMCAALAFIVPVFWVGPKIGLASYVYLLSNDRPTENPIAVSWRITTGHYWSTVGLTFLLVIVMMAVSMVFSLVAYIFALIPHVGVLFAAPIICLGSAWLYQVFYLALTRWTYALMQRDVALGGALLTA